MKKPELLKLSIVALAFLFNGAFQVAAQDAGLVAVLKQQTFVQVQPAGPTLEDSEDAIGLWTLVEPAGEGTILSATVELTSGETNDLFYNPVEAQFVWFDSYPDLESLNDAYPDGEYTVNIETLNDGPQSLSVTLGGNAWPSAPRVSNLPDFQGFDATQDFTLTWDGMVGGTQFDSILVIVESPQTGQIFETALPGEPGALNGTATSVVIPADTFDPGVTLEAELAFVRIAGFNPTYSGAFAAYVKFTNFGGRTLGGTDATPPNLAETAPGIGWVNVDRDAVVSFTFDEPMQSTTAIEWPGNPGVTFTYSWSSDQRTLFCIPDADLPADTLMAWVLNPDSQPAGFKDLAGNLLATVSGDFTTSGQTAVPGADVSFVAVGKIRMYRQTGPARSGPLRFGAFAEMDLRTVNAATEGTVTLPNGRTAFLQPGFGHFTLDVEAEFAQDSDLSRLFPDGDYTINVQTVNDGPRTLTLSLSGGAYPNGPSINNWSATQAVDPNAPFQLNWDPFIGGTASDFIDVWIESDYGNEVFFTPDPGEDGALDGTDTGVTIPAGVLAPGRTYTVNVLFAKITDFDTTSYPGADLLAGYLAETGFTMSTTGEIQPPSLTVLSSEGGNFQFEVNGARGIPYRIEAATSFPFWGWVGDVTISPETGSNVFSFPLSESQQFFRAVEGF